MKLHLTAQSERGKPVTKSGNEYLDVEITIDRIPVAILRVNPIGNDEFSVDYYTDMREGADFTHGIVVKSVENSKIRGVVSNVKQKYCNGEGCFIENCKGCNNVKLQ